MCFGTTPRFSARKVSVPSRAGRMLGRHSIDAAAGGWFQRLSTVADFGRFRSRGALENFASRDVRRAAGGSYRCWRRAILFFIAVGREYRRRRWDIGFLLEASLLFLAPEIARSRIISCALRDEGYHIEIAVAPLLTLSASATSRLDIFSAPSVL